MAGAQVGFEVEVVHRSFRMDGVARLVSSDFQCQSSFGPRHIVRIE